MSSNPKKLKTLKKKGKLQSKKRKLEAFLDSVRKDEETCLQRKKVGNSLQESYKALKDELKKFQTKQIVHPLFYLTDDGHRALVDFSLKDKSSKCISPLFVEDIYHLLLRSILGNLSSFPLRWAKIEYPQNISKTVLIEVEGLSQKDVVDLNTELNINCNIFPHVLETVSSNVAFATELSTLHLATGFYNQAKKNISSVIKNISLFPTNKNVCTQPKDKPTKLHLLLSPIQLAMGHYPLPPSVLEQSKSKDYCLSKESYTPVTADSPMFALDCEMCLTSSKKPELTRIAVVNESLETVYHTLVKPEAKIVNYMTKFSGITEKMLKNVTTTLDDVRTAIRIILPSDAILCGQSLENDLHAMKMIHPYVIDTSIIFNQSGLRQRKTSLKQLARIYLKEIIQDGKMGHHPVEDSIATMKLVQLKLNNSLNYGDAVLSSEGYENMEASEYKANICSEYKYSICSKYDDNTAENLIFSDFVKLYTGPEYDGFFSRISKFSKKVCIIGSEVALKNYCTEMVTGNVTQVIKSSVQKIIKATSNNLENHDLIISHIMLDEKNPLADINNGLKQAYESFPNRTLFIVVLTGGKPNDGNFKRSLCMAVVKKS